MPEELTILELRTPKDSEETPEAAAQFFAALPKLSTSFWQRLTSNHTPLTFEIALINQTIYFLAVLPKSQQAYMESQLTASYPKLVITPLKEYLPSVDKLPHPKAGLLTQTQAYYLPLKSYQDFHEVDPLATVLGTLAKAQEGDFILIQYLVAPAPSNWQSAGTKAVEEGIQRKNPDGTFHREAHPKKPLIDKKIAEPGFRVGIKLLTSSSSASRSSSLLTNLAGAFGSFTEGSGNSLALKRPRVGYQKLLANIRKRTFNQTSKHQYLSSSELATLYHLPNDKLNKIKNIAWGQTLLGEPPENLPIATNLSEKDKKEINFFGRTEFKNRNTVFGIHRPDRRKHVYIIGKTGSGKSTLIANQAINDMKNGEGMAIIDPHGDLVEIILNYVPKSRINDVCYFNPADIDHPISLNLLEVRDPAHRELVSSGILAIFQKLYGHSWGPRLEYILRNTLLTVTARPDSTMADIPKILTNKNFRQKVVEKIQEPILKAFWVDEFEKMNEKLRTEAISPILNKVGQFVQSPTIRRILETPRSSVNIEDIMDSGKIFIANLSQGKLGEDNAALLGAMLITRIQLAALNRVNVAEKDRRDFYLYVDEFQNFATTSFIKILSEARKYRLNLTLANQYIGQVPEDVQKAIFGNVGTLMSFILGAQDANIFAREFGQTYKEEDLVILGLYQIVLKLSIDQRTSEPFPAQTLPLAKSSNLNRGKVIRISRERYAKKK